MVGTGRLFAAMFREEFRMHADLFGGRRFAGFPLSVGAMAAGAVWLTTDFTDVSTVGVVAGLHVLVFAFGLHTGSIGLVGRDAMQNLMGGVTLLLFSARTLPLSRRRLLAVFVVKDVAYYALLFLLPLSVALLAGGLGPAVGFLWLTTTLTFALGLSVVLTAVALSTRGAPGWTVLIVLAAVVGLAYAAGVDPVALTPYALWTDPSATTAAVAVVPSVVLGAAGLGLIDLTDERAARTVDPTFRRWHDRLPGDRPMVAKSLLDVTRSGGGFVKIAVSAGVLFAVTVGMLSVAETLTGVEASVGVSMGALLGLSAFTTYHWVTCFDARSEYGGYPLSVGDLFRAKFRAFVVLGVPTALAYLGLAVVLLGARPVEVAVGGVLTVGLLLYLFGLTTYLAGLQPNEFLFDTVLFAAFGAAVAVVLVPVLVIGLTLAPLSLAMAAGLVVYAAVVGAVGLLTYRRGIPKWTERYRAGG